MDAISYERAPDAAAAMDEGRWLAVDVEGVGGRRLHAECGFEPVDARLQGRLAARGQMLAVQLGDEIELGPLFGRR